MSWARNALLTAAAAFTLAMVGLAVLGGYRTYSPVPFWDMWDGTLGFYIRVKDGATAEWWSQMNEHRIILSRLLFWADYEWFGGLSVFLIAVNYVLAAAAALAFWKFLLAVKAADEPAWPYQLLGLFLTSWLFLWTQDENFSWGFQSQFFMAQSLPLWALYWLQRSTSGMHTRRDFAVASAFGAASIVTMANGLLALPLMTLYALVMRERAIRVAILAGLSIVGTVLYFQGYIPPEAHSSLWQSLQQGPAGYLRYIGLYLGGPFYYLLDGHAAARPVALAAAAVLPVASAWVAARVLREPRRRPASVALLFFILYIGGTAFGTAGGRLIFGSDQALSHRYTTPALMAWAALLVLLAPPILAASRGRALGYALALCALAAVMAHLQLKAALPQEQLLFERDAAALALELQARDQLQVSHVYPRVDSVLKIAQQASERHLSVFGAAPLHDANRQLGTRVEPGSLPPCQGGFDAVEFLEGEARLVRVDGWLAKSAGLHSKGLRFFDTSSRVAGFAILGAPRPGLAATGFRGYVMANQVGKAVTLRSDSCELTLQLPTALFSASRASPSPDRATVEGADVQPGNGWTGGDFSKTAIGGMQVFGSFISSDADTGSIRLKVRRGARLFYRSGPTGGKQLLAVLGSSLPAAKLPVSADWSLIELSSPSLPEGEFTIELTDQGAGWGEWSAIAVRSSK
jgi:hypothetical protein